MSMDYRLPNPNKKLTENLVRQFAERSVKGSDEIPLQGQKTLSPFFVTTATPTRLLSQSKMKKQAKSRKRKKLFLDKHLKTLLKTVTWKSNRKWVCRV